MALEGVIRFVHCTGSTAAMMLAAMIPTLTNRIDQGSKSTITYFTKYITICAEEIHQCTIGFTERILQIVDRRFVFDRRGAKCRFVVLIYAFNRVL